MTVALLHFKHVLLSRQLSGVLRTLPFFMSISAHIFHLALSCLSIGQSSFIYQQMRTVHTHTIEDPTAILIVKIPLPSDSFYFIMISKVD